MMGMMSATLILTTALLCCISSTHSAVTTGYFYDNPIRPYNPSTQPTIRPYANIPYGQKVETTSRPHLKVPPIPSLPPLTTYKPTQTTRYQLPFVTQPSQRANQQQGQTYQQQQTAQQSKTQFQQPQPTHNTYSYPKPQVPFSTQLPNAQQYSNTFQQKTNTPQVTPRQTTSQFHFSTTPSPVQRQTTKPSMLTLTSTQLRTSNINANSNPTQTILATGLLGSPAGPDFYVVDGRQLKQYKVYEEIDNDIDQEVHNFLPSNFFLNSYHSLIGDTHPLGEGVQVQNRASGFQQNLQISPRTLQQQQMPNTIALGSGGLGFVKLPNGSVYLGSGSLGYISNTQHSQDVQNLRSRTGSSAPDALHFGHGSLSDSFYYQNQKD